MATNTHVELKNKKERESNHRTFRTLVDNGRSVGRCDWKLDIPTTDPAAYVSSQPNHRNANPVDPGFFFERRKQRGRTILVRINQYIDSIKVCSGSTCFGANSMPGAGTLINLISDAPLRFRARGSLSNERDVESRSLRNGSGSAELNMSSVKLMSSQLLSGRLD